MTEIVNKNQENSAESYSDADAVTGLFPRRPNLAALRNMRILLVDDLPTNIILAQAILEHGGFSNVITAESGDRALQTLEKQTRDGICSIDIVLLDIILPGKNGYSVCRSIRRNPAWNHIPVIMVTSDTKWKEETALAAFESGATDILFKPVQSAKLIPRVISALSLKSERDSRIAREKYFRKKTEEHALVEARLKYLVIHDEHTGLLNRRRLDQLLELSILYARNYERAAALIYIDINDFCRINEQEGYKSGDKLLVEVASLLKQFAGEQYHAARIGTDQFAMLVDDCNADIARNIVQRLYTTLNNAQYKSVSMPVRIRAGVAMIGKHDELLCSAIIAHAKTASDKAKNTETMTGFYSEDIQE